MIRPFLCAIMCGNAYLVVRNGPVSITPINWFHFSSGKFRNGGDVLQAGIVHQNVDARVAVNRHADQAHDVLDLRNIAEVEHRFSPRRR